MISVPIYILSVEGMTIKAITATTTVYFDCETAIQSQPYLVEQLQTIIEEEHMLFWEQSSHRLLFNEETADSLLVYDEVKQNV